MKILNIKKESIESLNKLCVKIRSFLICSVANTGGHLAPSLGVVELSVALHYVFTTPNDKIIWDVGHQAYVHKILTNRADKFNTLRKKGGISGFPNIFESKHDAFGAGHASTSISAGLGIAAARDLKGENFNVISVIGDGALTGGMAFEGLNQLGYLQKDMIIILNDNKMSISMNVGALSNFTKRITKTELYRQVKEKIKGLSKKCDSEQLSDLKNSLKQVASPAIIFEKLGINYLGPIDGHNLKELINVLREAKQIKGPKIIHVITKKGKGYKTAEINACKFHGIGPFHVANGNSRLSSENITYTKAFSHAIINLAKKNKKIVAITAAMPDGTGLDKFAKIYPDRFFDVGIAEQHAVTFAAGLARIGIRPVVAIYSTFLQRAFDQIIHDVCLQKLPVVFAIDRAGLVGADGPTHHGSFDLSFLRLIPNLIIASPKDEQELCSLMHAASKIDLPMAIRYPRGSSGKYSDVNLLNIDQEILIGKAEIIKDGSDIILIGIGSTVDLCTKASKQLQEDYRIDVQVINARFIKPLDKNIIKRIIEVKKAIIVEENTCIGGLYSAILEKISLSSIKIKSVALPDKFVEHGSIDLLKEDCNLTQKKIVEEALNF